jgi:predicted amidohydrolase
MKFTLSLAQTAPKLGDLAHNLAEHLALIRSAAEQKADLIIFPELSLTGYNLQDLASTVSIKAVAEDAVFGKLLQASSSIDVIVGFVEEGPRQQQYISAAYLSKGQLVHIHRKVYLPTYGIFDERRYFAAGDSFRAFDTRFGRVGMLICEDFWHVSSPYALWMDGADLMYFISASPGRGVTDEVIGSAAWVENITRSYSGLFTTFVAHSNRVGFEDGLNFWGGSTVHDPDGKILLKAPYDDKSLTLATIDLNQLRRTRTRLPLLRDEQPDLLVKELNRIQREKETK